MFEPGEVVICIESGADAPNPWHRANPLTVGAEYTVLGGPFQHRHANGRRMEDSIAVDLSGRLWKVSMFRKKGRETDISFAHEILARFSGPSVDNPQDEEQLRPDRRERVSPVVEIIGLSVEAEVHKSVGVRKSAPANYQD